MTPRPVVVVAGGTGNVGEGVVRRWLAAGAQVVVPSRTEARLAELRERLGAAAAGDALVGVTGSIGDADDAPRVALEIQSRVGEVDHVVASLGGWWQGAPLLRIPIATWRAILDDILTSHFVAAQALVPLQLARPDATYALVNGFSAEQPYPGAGPVSVGAAAQLMFGRILAEELRGTVVRVNELVLGPVMSRARTRGQADWISADDVGDFARWIAGTPGVRARVFRLLDQGSLATERTADVTAAG